jgi:MoaA/NifB/PqqE/SkfB family radical SAM enzyme
MTADAGFIDHVSSAHQLQLDGTKIGWYPERVAAWKRGERIAPITMDVAWTRKCAAACNFCYAQLQASEDTVITRQNALDYLDDAAEIGVKGVSLISDGESTEVPFFAESVGYGARRGLQIGTSSNGLKLTPEVLEQILPGLTYLRFNFSGGDKHRWAQIMGLKQPLYDRVIANIKAAIAIKKRDNLPVNINMQFVVMPKDGDQIVPFAKLAKEIRPDYAILKHCAESADGDLGVDYRQYSALFPQFQEAEALSDEGFRVAVKWSRIEDEGKRDYQRCYGPPFILQMSGNGLIAPCGQKFNSKYAKFHIGNITRDRFRDIFASDRYWEVMDYLRSDEFDAQKDCGENCLQTNTNSWLNKFNLGQVGFPTSPAPAHLGFL